MFKYWGICHKFYIIQFLGTMAKISAKARKLAKDDWRVNYITKAKLFQQLFDDVLCTPFDDFTLELTWTVKDVSKFHEVEQKFPYWKISFVKNRGKKKKVQIELSKNFKSMEDALVDEVLLEDELEDQMYENLMRHCEFV